MFQGLVMKIPPEDYFTEKLTEIRDLGSRWADTAKQVIISYIIHRESASILPHMIILLILYPLRYKQVSADGGVLGLDRVFALIYEGESLPVSCEKELKVNDREILMANCPLQYCYPELVAAAVAEGSEHALLHLSETIRPESYDRLWQMWRVVSLWLRKNLVSPKVLHMSSMQSLSGWRYASISGSCTGQASSYCALQWIFLSFLEKYDVWWRVIYENNVHSRNS